MTVSEVVLMPFLPSLKQYDSHRQLRVRWEMVKTAFKAPILSVDDLLMALQSYNFPLSSKWRFQALQDCLSEIPSHASPEIHNIDFFDNLLPRIIKLALCLPEIFPEETNNTQGQQYGHDNQPGYSGQGNQPGYQGQGNQPGYQSQGNQPGYPGQGNQPGYPGQGNQPGYPGQGNQPGYQGQGNQPGYQGQGNQSGHRQSSSIRQAAGQVPLLASGTSAEVTLSQLQVASLLANAFLCTFPRRSESKAMFRDYPTVNFNTLFSSQRQEITQTNKLFCILNYFNRVTNNTPQGHVTFTRLVTSDEDFDKLVNEAWARPMPHVTFEKRKGIEDAETDALQVIFGNKVFGGGVLSRGSAQEEIRCVMSPELIVARLFSQTLADNEALMIQGVERFNNYSGYSMTFQWAGNHEDITPWDSQGHRLTSLVTIDAEDFACKDTNLQFSRAKVDRELRKAVTGFGARAFQGSRVASGSWGCGAFRGDARLKFTLQLLACAITDRGISFHVVDQPDQHVQNDLEDIVKLVQGSTVGEVLEAVYRFCDERGQGSFHNLRQCLQRDIDNNYKQLTSAYRPDN